MQTKTKERLEAARLELLDLTLRNPLLNHRKRAKQAAIAGESSTGVFKQFVTDNKTMSFFTAPENGKEAETKDKKDSSKLHAELEPAKLQKTLLSISNDARI